MRRRRRCRRPADLPQSIHSRSVTLSSERLRVIAKMDLVEAEGGVVTPVDYKHGRPREGPDGLELWPADRAQLAVQGIVLRENGYECDEGIVYYRKTGQRVRVAFDDGADGGDGAADRAGVGDWRRRARFRRRWSIRRSVRAARWWGSACRTKRWRPGNEEEAAPQQLALFGQAAAEAGEAGGAARW